MGSTWLAECRRYALHCPHGALQSAPADTEHSRAGVGIQRRHHLFAHCTTLKAVNRSGLDPEVLGLLTNRIKLVSHILYGDMVDTTPVTSNEHLRTVLVPDKDCSLNEGQCDELWDVWTDYIDWHGDSLLLMVPGWFAESEFGSRRPFLFAEVEYDDPENGAVLFSETHMANISIIENEALGDAEVPIETCVEEFDISDEDDYIEESGHVWIPRSLLTIFERSG